MKGFSKEAKGISMGSLRKSKVFVRIVSKEMKGLGRETNGFRKDFEGK